MAETVLTAIVIVAIGIILIGDSSARDLRPSDHGLVFQTLSPTGAKSSPEMRSFFNSDSQNSSSLSSATSSSNVAIPRAMNSPAAPPSWIREASAAVGPNGGDRVSKALMAASMVCGTVGAILLLASGLVYLLKYRTKQKQNAASFGGEGVDRNNQIENDDDNNKLQLVVCEP
ncbi:hypothetical protein PIB30_004642 [Stylosanthes scabra]|uniref:Uncharacterized protein n=1 Tax=Stylosanthes scabra TaxID=79078 RepID=A0ABU6Q4H0_9FABA|nr:hypothetical protein [Stylosanthes scabra]